ncbi:MAG: histidine kinase [Burkholderiales bacterium]|nr:histidine kinase [Burkholderiales bacterium]
MHAATAPLTLARAGWRAIPRRHFVIAAVLALVWAGANTLGWTLGHASIDVPRTAGHLLYEALLTMLLLAAFIGVADAATRDDPNAVAPYAIAAIAAAILGEILFTATAPLLGLIKCGCSMDRWPPGARIANMLPDSLIICGFVTAGYRYWRRTSLRMARLHARELEHARLTRRTAESRLQALQACIEPQFLFDTLAAVERMHASDPRNAVRLIDELIVYLRAALPHLRESTSTVAKETELAQAWLNIQRLRHGRGPAFAIDVATGAEGASLPPMVLLPLVDYLLADPGEHGSLRIAVDAADDTLRIELAGHGIRGPAGESGRDKLAGLRERLHSLYGDTARLTLGSAGADTILVTLTLPHERSNGDPG